MIPARLRPLRVVAFAVALSCAVTPPAAPLPADPLLPARMLSLEQYEIVAEVEDRMNAADAAFIRGGWAKAVEEYRTGLKRVVPLLAPEDPLVDVARHNLVVAWTALGEYASAEQQGRENLELRRGFYGARHPWTAASRVNLGVLYRALGRYREAEIEYQAALETYRHPDAELLDLTNALGLLGVLYLELGDLRLAEPPIREAIERIEAGRALPARERAAVLAEPVNSLANLESARGDLPAAGREYERAVELLRTAYGADHPYVAVALGNVADNLLARRDFERAEAHFLRALEIQEKHFERPHRDVALTLANLAGLYREQERYPAAERTFKRAISTAERALDRDHAEVAIALTSLGALYSRTGRPELARPAYERAEKILRASFGEEHPHLGTVLANLGGIARVDGDLAEARTLYGRALEIYEKTLPPAHPLVAEVAADLGRAHWAEGDVDGALRWLGKGNRAREQSMQLMLAAGSEEQKLAYAQTWDAETDATIHFHLTAARGRADALKLAVTTALQRKGRVLDAVSAQLAALRSRLEPRDRARLDELASTRARLAALSLRARAGAPSGEELALLDQLRERTRELERALADSLPASEKTHAATLKEIRAAIPRNAALVEFVGYHEFDPMAPEHEAQGGRRYVAYVLRRGEEPAFADLGPAGPIDEQVDKLLAALADARQLGSMASRRKARRMGRVLDRSLMGPIRAYLGDAEHLLLAPDGSLHLVPFGALVDIKKRFLIQRYTFTYLGAGRDLLSMDAHRKARGPVVLVANPDYGPGYWTQLPGTELEARALEKIVKQPRVFSGAQASETALKQLHGPRVLHVATHGFFHSLAKRGMAEGVGTRGSGPSALQHPLLRSGIVLAGANLGARDANADDGILTALEATGLDLDGTQLVVLSACETALGRIDEGEGVFGLRRAFAIAGAATQVISLWKVPDEATRDLMVLFYIELIDNKRGRSEALRAAQLTMIEEGHPPYAWAAFIPSGDWRPL